MFLLIKECRGFELEKSLSNSPEHYFNRSEVTYIEHGEEKTLHVLYLRYFDESLETYTPFSKNPLFQINGKDICLHDIAAVVCLLKNSQFHNRKRVYINNKKEFASLFEGVNFEKLIEMFTEINRHQAYEISPIV
jgi:hypothetical protein